MEAMPMSASEQAFCPETVTVRVAAFEPEVLPYYEVTFNARDTPVTTAVERVLAATAIEKRGPFMISVEVR